MVIQCSRSPLEQLELFPDGDLAGYVKVIEKLWKGPFPFEPSLAALFRIGSHSHGTYVPPEDPTGIDDVDFLAVVIPPFEHVVGLHRFEHATIKEGNIDCIIYEWSKYIRLLQVSNPNVIGTLYLNRKDVWTKAWSPFVEGFYAPLPSRNRFLSLKMYDTFVGYAKGQLYKMTHQAFQGYMGDKRKKLVEKFGYDTKNAAHLIRLLRMGCEAFETGTMKVLRPDAKELISIKKGEWKLEDVMKEAQLLFDRIAIAESKSQWPKAPDPNFIDNVICDGYLNWWPETKEGRY